MNSRWMRPNCSRKWGESLWNWLKKGGNVSCTWTRSTQHMNQSFWNFKVKKSCGNISTGIVFVRFFLFHEDLTRLKGMCDYTREWQVCCNNTPVSSVTSAVVLKKCINFLSIWHQCWLYSRRMAWRRRDLSAMVSTQQILQILNARERIIAVYFHLCRMIIVFGCSNIG